MPRRCASGAKICIVSSATLRCRSARSPCSVRMLCRRSPNLMTMTRKSRAIASRILRRFSADDLVSIRFLRRRVYSDWCRRRRDLRRQAPPRHRHQPVGASVPSPPTALLEVRQFQLGDAIHQFGDLGVKSAANCSLVTPQSSITSCKNPAARDLACPFPARSEYRRPRRGA